MNTNTFKKINKVIAKAIESNNLIANIIVDIGDGFNETVDSIDADVHDYKARKLIKKALNSPKAINAFYKQGYIVCFTTEVTASTPSIKKDDETGRISIEYLSHVILRDDEAVLKKFMDDMAHGIYGEFIHSKTIVDGFIVLKVPRGKTLEEFYNNN